MGFFKDLKGLIMDKPMEVKEPIFIKDFQETNSNISSLESIIPFLSKKERSYAETELKLFKLGLEGEKNVYYELKNSFLPILCLHDVRVAYKEYSAQLDYIVISPKIIYILECKKLSGDITINGKGEFIRSIKNYQGNLLKTEGTYSPIAQNDRHVRIVQELLVDKIGIKHSTELIKGLAVMANPKCIVDDVQAEEELQNKIIKYDQLHTVIKKAIEDRNTEFYLTKNRMYEVAECLLSHHKPLDIDYMEKYKVEIPTVQPDVTEREKDTSKINVEAYGESMLEAIYKDMQAIVDRPTVEENNLFESLRKWRLSEARRENLKPYFVFTNAELEALIEAKPKSKEELLTIKGFGPIKVEKYGEAILEIIAKHQKGRF